MLKKRKFTNTLTYNQKYRFFSNQKKKKISQSKENHTKEKKNLFKKENSLQYK